MIERLYQEICNHLKLGQWELARAFVLLYVDELRSNEGPETVKNLEKVKNLLLEVGHDPSLCIGSSNILSPFHLSWLCVLLLEELGVKSDEVEYLKKDADFKLLLKRAGQTLNDRVPYEDCYNLFLKKHSSVDILSSAHESGDLKVFIYELLDKDPTLGCFIYCAVEAIDDVTNSNLILSWLCECCNILNENLKESSHQEECDRLAKRILQVLSLYFFINHEALISEELSTKLFELVTDGVITIGDVYTVLCYNPKNVTKFCYHENTQCNRIVANENFSSRQHFLRTVFENTDRLNIKELFLRSVLNNRHFLDIIVNFLVDMMAIKEYSLVIECLSNSIIAPLRPLILLVFWEKISNKEEAIYIVNMFWPKIMVKENFHCLLSDSCDRLLDEIKVASWCIEQYDLNPHAVKTPLSFYNLHLNLKKHSTIYTLNKCLDISQIREDEILEILHYLPSRKRNKREKSVQFTDDENPMQMNEDVIIFQGYIIMRTVMDLILLSSKDNIHLKGTRSKVLSDKDKKNFSEIADGENYLINRNQELNEKMAKIRDLISNLYPISFRVEILENLFSLIFVNHKHLVDDEPSDTEYSNDVTDEFIKTCSSPTMSPSIKKSEDYKSSQLLENTTSLSTCSSSCCNNASRIGFLCDDQIIRLLLICINESILEAAVIVDNPQNSGPLTWEEFLSSKQSSILSKNLNQSIKSLKRYVTEAIWKYDLVQTSSDTERDIKPVQKKFQPYCPIPCQFYLQGSKISKKTKVADDAFCSEETVARETTVIDVSDNRGKRRPHYYHRLCRTTKCVNVGCQHGTINCMLSSPMSLLHMCLLQRDLGKASQVIQMFTLQKTDSATEASFLTDYPEMYDQLQKSSGNLQQPVLSTDSNLNTSFSSRSSISNILQTAAVGLHSASDATLIDNLFTRYKMPKLPELVSLQKLHPELFSLLEIGSSEDLRPLAISDIVFMAGPSLEISTNVLFNSQKRVTLLMDASAVHRSSLLIEGDVIGFASYLQQILDCITVLKQKQNDGSLLNKFQCFKTHSNFHEFFMSSLEPLNSFYNREVLDSFNRLGEAVSNFELALQSVRVKGVNEIPETLDSDAKKASNKVFRNLVLAASEIVGQGIIPEEITGQESTPRIQYPDYLKSLFIYLRQLAALFTHCSIDTEPETKVTYLDILDKDLVSILGNLILSGTILPEEVESFTDKLNLNLTQIITTTVCGRLPARGITFGKKDAVMTRNHGQQRVLNALTTWNGEVRTPDVVAIDLLQQAVKLLSESSCKKCSCVVKNEIVNSASWSSFLESTQELALVDLKLLKSQEDCLAFLINIANLLMIHSILIKGSFENSKEYLLSQRLSDACINTYSIGQISCISLFDLHSLLIGECSFGFGLPEEMTRYYNKFFSFELPLPQSKILFVLVFGTIASPKLQVMSSADLSGQINSSMNDYLNVHTGIDELKKQIYVPPLLKHFQGSENLLEIIESHCSDDLVSNMKALTAEQEEKIVDDCVIFKPDNNNWAIVLDYRNNYCQHDSDYDDLDKSIKPLPLPVLEYVDRKYPLIARVLQLLTTDSFSFEENDILNDLLQQFDHMTNMDILLPVCQASHFWIKLNDYIMNNDWLTALDFMQTSLQLGPALLPYMLPIKDYILCVLAAMDLDNEALQKSNIKRIKNSRIRAIHVLTFYKKWSFEVCCNLLRFCANDSSLEEDLAEQLSLCLQKVEIYELILLHIPHLDSWQNVAEEIAENPENIIEILLSQEKYQLALSWAKFHDVPLNLQQLVNVSQLTLLFDVPQPDTVTILKVLESIPPQMCIKCCEQVCANVQNMNARAFILEYLLVTCKEILNLEEKQKFLNHYIGVKIGQNLNELDLIDFMDIITNPQLMLEQLIMNMKIDQLANIMKDIWEDEIVLKMSSKVFEEIDALMRNYAKKAINIPMITPQVTAVPYTDMFVPPSRSMQFTIPPVPPRREDWIQDEVVKQCMSCKQVTFTMLNRRHHCRRCGRVVCGVCSNHWHKVEGYGDVKVRICKDCKIYDFETSSIESALLSSPFTEKKGRTISMGQLSNVSPANKTSRSPSISSRTLYIPPSIWKLTLEDEHNEIVRQEFNFEQIPNVHLSMALLELHSNKNKAAYYLLDLCTSLLSKLRPTNLDVPNPEIDYDLLICMAEALLLTAKLKFAELQDHEKISSCDQIRTFIILTRILIQNNCHHLLPSEIELVSDFAKPLLRLLIEEERWTLAMEVASKVRSEKINFESRGLWISWGLAALKVGDFQTAREKFDRALTQRFDRRHVQYLSNTVDDIVTELEKKLYNPEEQGLDVLYALSTLGSIQRNGVTAMKFSHARGLKVSNIVFEECIYYLETYGTPFMVLNFLSRHDYIKKALQYALEKKVSSEAFINGIVMPCLKSDKLHTLEDRLIQIDSTKQKFKKYLDSVCSYFQDKKYYNTLLRFQHFIEKYDAAAQTCIKLYCKTAFNYSILFDHIEHLYEARKYLEKSLTAFIESPPQTGSKDVYVSSPRHYAKEINRKIRIIDLQIEVNKFLIQDKMLATQQFDQAGFSKTVVHTLFGTSSSVVEIGTMVLIAGKSVEDGFGICFRIMKEFNLNPVMVFGHCSRQLIKSKRTPEVIRLIKCILTSGEDSLQVVDKVISDCMCLLIQDCAESKEIEALIKMIASDEHKINAYILCGKLKSAYLVAVKTNRVDDIRRIMSAAERLGQSGLKQICEKKLAGEEKS